ncbi:MAG: TIM barrel protein [Christensenellales bacterium]
MEYKKQIRIAVASSAAAPATAPIPLVGDLFNNLERAYKLGYQGLEFHTRENADIDWIQFHKHCLSLGMSMASIVSGKLCNELKVSLIDDDASKVRTAIDGMKRYIDIAQILKTDVIVGWIKGNIPDLTKKDYYEHRLADGLLALAQYTEGKGVNLMLEAINRYESNWFNTSGYSADYIRKFSIPRTYVHLDTFHMNIEETDMAEAIRYSGDKLGYLHLADNTRMYPGTGTVDFKKVVDALHEINYQGFMSLECLPLPTGEEAARLALKTMRAIE